MKGALTEDGHEDKGEQDERERHHAIHDTHDHRVNDAAKEAGDEAKQDADDGAEDGAADGDEDRDARTIDHAGEKVATIGVSAKQVTSHPGSGKHVAGIRGVRITRSKQGRKDGENHHHDDDRKAHERHLVTSELVPGVVRLALTLEHLERCLVRKASASSVICH